MRSRALAVCLLLLNVTCRQESPKQVVQPVAARKPPARKNLLSVVHGGVVVDRSGELSFEHSVFDALDGDLNSFWAGPPGDPVQWMVVELPVRSRLTEVGLAFPSDDLPPVTPAWVAFELSSDGRTFHQVARLLPQKKHAVMVSQIPPTEARWVKMTVSAAQGQPVFSVPELLAHGEELEPWKAPEVTGRWLLNGVEAAFQQKGNHVKGRVAMTPQMDLDGGWSGRIIRLNWVRGKQRGVACITIAGDHLMGMWWFEKAVKMFMGTPWFGERSGNATPAINEDIADRMLQVAGRRPLFELAFDDAGNILQEQSADGLARLKAAPGGARQIRLESFEHQAEDPASDLALSRKRLRALVGGFTACGADCRRIDAAALGANDPEGLSDSDLQKAIYSRIDLVAPRPGKN
jgi:hypothetical protein